MDRRDYRPDHLTQNLRGPGWARHSLKVPSAGMDLDWRLQADNCAT